MSLFKKIFQTYRKNKVLIASLVDASFFLKSSDIDKVTEIIIDGIGKTVNLEFLMKNENSSIPLITLRSNRLEKVLYECPNRISCLRWLQF